MKWEKAYIGDCCDITSSKRVFFSDYVDFGIPFFRSKEIIERSENKEISEPLYISKHKYMEIKQKYGVPQCGDMLLTSVGTIGIPYLVKADDVFYFKDGNLTWFKDFSKDLLSKYLFYWIRSKEGQGVLNNSTIGSSQKALTIAALKKLKFHFRQSEFNTAFHLFYHFMTVLLKTTKSKSSCWKKRRSGCIKNGLLTCASPDMKPRRLLMGCLRGGFL